MKLCTGMLPGATGRTAAVRQSGGHYEDEAEPIFCVQSLGMLLVAVDPDLCRQPELIPACQPVVLLLHPRPGRRLLGNRSGYSLLVQFSVSGLCRSSSS